MPHIATERAAAGSDHGARAVERYAFTGQIDIAGQSVHVSGILLADAATDALPLAPPVISRDQLLRELMTGGQQKQAPAEV